MNFSAFFIRRPVATTLLMAAILLAGALGYTRLSVAPLPQVDFPTIVVNATLPGASPETMASSVATPLERHLGQIADVSEMTSSSAVGATSITLQFSLNRDIDGAARDVQAAINAARADLPTSLRSNPTYRKANPADLPITILSLTSDTLSPGELYDIASSVIGQKLSQVPGVGDVTVAGSSLPAVRVELNPSSLFKYGIGLEDVRAALAAANANSPKGAVEDGRSHWQIYSNDQSRSARDYRSLIVAVRNQAPVRLSDVAQVEDSVEDTRNLGLSGNRPAVLLLVTRQPGINVIETVDRIRALLPQLEASIPAAAQLSLSLDRSTPIRASLRDVELSLFASVILVILVVFFFLRDWRATLIPSVAVPVSLIGTFAAMYLLGYSLDNLSLMALTVATGFVIDDAIVVMENIYRHIEAGVPRTEASLAGAREVGFTVVSMSLSLIAVFIPIALMSGVVGRLFREFAMTLTVAVCISLLISISAVPAMCSRLLRRQSGQAHGPLYRWSEGFFAAVHRGYERSLTRVLGAGPWVLLVFAAAVALNIVLFRAIPKGFFPEEDSGRMSGGVQGDESISFQGLAPKLRQFVSIIEKDPDVESVVGQIGSGQAVNSGHVNISLKPLGIRKTSGLGVIARLRPKLAAVAGATLYLQVSQDIKVGGRQSASLYQFTLQADNLAELRTWTPRLLEALKNEPILTDLNSDQQDKGLQAYLDIDRDTASRLGLSASQIDNTLYDAFGQRQVSTIYKSLNQYHVVMVVAPQFRGDPETLNDLYVSTSGGAASGSQLTNAPSGTVKLGTAQSNSTGTGSAAIAADSARNASLNSIASSGKSAASSGQAVSTNLETMVPLGAFAHYKMGTTPLAVSHQGNFVAGTISFNLAPGASLSDAVHAVDRQIAEIHMPATLHGSFQGTAKTYEATIADEPMLILAAIVAVYIVLGVLYESYAHPLTILSTLPSAGLGAVLALMLFKAQFDLIALIGVILLIGIVKKNAIMMVDFALQLERNQGLDPREAILQASLLRFRPILMTTFAAMLGALPLAIGFGTGAELRQPLGISIVGGLAVSQILTLYTTPVIHLYVNRARLWVRSLRMSISRPHLA